VGPCHHGMALPRVADVGDGVQIWRVAVKQSRTANKEWSSSLGSGRGATTPLQNQLLMKCYTDRQTWTCSLERPRQRKMDMKFVTWDVRSLYRESSLETVVRGLAKCRLDLVVVQEVRWDTSGNEPGGDYTYLHDD